MEFAGADILVNGKEIDNALEDVKVLKMLKMFAS